MDIPTITTITNLVVSLLIPYLKDMGSEIAKKTNEKITEKAGDIATEKIKNLFDTVRKKLSTKTATKEILDDFATSPDDKDLQASLRVQLKKTMLSDVKFAKKITDILKQDLGYKDNNFFSTNITGDFHEISQIQNSTISTGRDFVGHDKVEHDKIEIHAQNLNWNSTKTITTDEAWIQQGIDWLKKGTYMRIGGWDKENEKEMEMMQYKDWEKHAENLTDESLYFEGRTLTENRRYPKAVAYWAELRKRNPNNFEHESYLRLCLSKVERYIGIEKAIHALMGMASSAMALGTYNSAVHYLKQVLVLSPNNPGAKRALEDAEQALSKINKQQKNDPSTEDLDLTKFFPVEDDD